MTARQHEKARDCLPIVQGLLASGHYTRDADQNSLGETIITFKTGGPNEGTFAHHHMPTVVVDAIEILETLEAQIRMDDEHEESMKRMVPVAVETK